MIPRFQHQALGAVFAELTHFVFLQHTKGLGGIIVAHYVAGVEDVAEFVAGEAVEAGVPSVEFGAQYRAAVGVKGVGRTVIAEILRPGLQVVGSIGEFQHARDEVGEVGGGVAVGGGGLATAS